jgi:hypothetical protein
MSVHIYTYTVSSDTVFDDTYSILFEAKAIQALQYRERTLPLVAKIGTFATALPGAERTRPGRRSTIYTNRMMPTIESTLHEHSAAEY